MNFLLGILEGGGSVEEHPLIQQLLDLFWLLMEVWSRTEFQEDARQAGTSPVSARAARVMLCVCVCVCRITR